MFCAKCGSKLPEGAKFCHQCGARVVGDAGDIVGRDKHVHGDTVGGDKVAGDKIVITDNAAAPQDPGENALQSYLDRIENLLDKGLRQSGEGDEIRALAEAGTFKTLRRLDGKGRGALIKFLAKTNLISVKPCIISLEGAEIAGADLSGANLTLLNLNKVNLSKANLSGAYLSGSHLIEADLHGANLRGANLSGEARLSRANLRGADLREATLDHANMYDADLREVDLREASLVNAYMVKANLKGAVVTDEQLALTKSLKGAIMPDGTKFTEPSTKSEIE